MTKRDAEQSQRDNTKRQEIILHLFQSVGLWVHESDVAAKHRLEIQLHKYIQSDNLY